MEAECQGNGHSFNCCPVDVQLVFDGFTILFYKMKNNETEIRLQNDWLGLNLAKMFTSLHD